MRWVWNLPRLAFERTGVGRRIDRGHCRSHHHLPLRAGSCRPGRAGGRDQPSVCPRRPAQDGRCARAPCRNRYRGVRQNRDADAGRPNLLNPGAIDRATLAAAAALAANSRHPYARALVRAARARGSGIEPVTGVQEMPGFGLERQTASGRERLGSPDWCGSKTRRGRHAVLSRRRRQAHGLQLGRSTPPRRGQDHAGPCAGGVRHGNPIRGPAERRHRGGPRSRRATFCCPAPADRQDSALGGARRRWPQGVDGR